MNNRRSPAAVLRVVQLKGDDVRMFGKDGMYGAAQRPDALAVDNAHLKDAPRQARLQVIRDKLLNLARAESVQVENAIDWKLDRLIHHTRIDYAPELFKAESEPRGMHQGGK